MGYKEAKVYREGYHYVAIHHKENPSAKKRGGVTMLGANIVGSASKVLARGLDNKKR